MGKPLPDTCGERNGHKGAGSDEFEIPAREEISSDLHGEGTQDKVEAEYEALRDRMGNNVGIRGTSRTINAMG